MRYGGAAPCPLHRGTSQPVSAQASLRCEENATGESRMSCCASTPSAGPRPLPAGIRSWVVARPRSIFRTRSPSTRRSPDSGAASAVYPRHQRRRIRRDHAICSIGALSQNGEIGSSSSSGPAQTSDPQRDAARSAAVCSRTWKGRLLRQARLRMAAAPFRPVCPRCSRGTARPGRRR